MGNKYLKLGTKRACGWNGLCYAATGLCQWSHAPLLAVREEPVSQVPEEWVVSNH